jgi:hypothetical protein
MKFTVRGRGEVPHEQRNIFMARDQSTVEAQSRAVSNIGMGLGIYSQPANDRNYPIMCETPLPGNIVSPHDAMEIQRHAERMNRDKMINIRDAEMRREPIGSATSRYDAASAFPKAGISSRDLSRCEINSKYEQTKNTGINKASYGTYGMY